MFGTLGFSGLDRNAISKIIDAMDESMAKDPFNSTGMQSLEKMGFTHGQSRYIVECFFNLYCGLQNPEDFMRIANNLDVDDDAKPLIMETFEAIRKKAYAKTGAVPARLSGMATKHDVACTLPSTGGNDESPDSNDSGPGTANKAAFKEFVKNNLHDPKFRNRYAIFAHGDLQDVGDDELELIQKTYERFGDVDMYVGKVSERRRVLLESPERR